MALDPSMGWALSPVGTPSQSTMQRPLSPSEVQQIQAMTSMMGTGQPSMSPVSPQQNSMMAGLFGPQSNLGQNLGNMGQAFAGGPAYGGGNIFTDAYGGNARAPLPGLTAQDYG